MFVIIIVCLCFSIMILKPRCLVLIHLVHVLDPHTQVHEAECRYQPQPCPQCNESILKDELTKHLATECRKRKVRCEHCREEVICDQMQVSTE